MMQVHLKPATPATTLALIISCVGDKRTNNTQATEALKCIIKSLPQPWPRCHLFRPQSFEVQRTKVMKIPETPRMFLHCSIGSNAAKA